MNRRILALLAAVALTALPATSQVAPQTPLAPAGPQTRTLDSVVALVNGELISAHDVRNRMYMLLMAYGGRQLTQEQQAQLRAQVQREAVEALIDEKVKLQEFTKLTKGATIEDEEIDEQLAYLARSNKLSTDQFIANFEASGANIKTLREQIRSQVAWENIIRGRYGKTVRISEQRISERLSRIEESMDKPQYRLAEIFLFAPDQASLSNARTRAAQIVERVNQGADFTQVARQFSAAPTASQGGDMGFLSQGDMRPEIAAAVLKAPEPPTVLEPIESESGIYIIAVTGKRDPSQAPPPTMNLIQVVAQGTDAEAKLQLVKNRAKTCNQVEAAVKEVPGTGQEAMADVSLASILPKFRGALEPLDAGSSTEVLRLEDGAAMMFYVCEKKAGGNEIPSREEIRDDLFGTELSMIAERYFRDLKRAATIERKT